jgi:hypothetical protein
VGRRRRGGNEKKENEKENGMKRRGWERMIPCACALEGM